MGAVHGPTAHGGGFRACSVSQVDGGVVSVGRCRTEQTLRFIEPKPLFRISAIRCRRDVGSRDGGISEATVCPRASYAQRPNVRKAYH